MSGGSKIGSSGGSHQSTTGPNTSSNLQQSGNGPSTNSSSTTSSSGSSSTSSQGSAANPFMPDKAIPGGDCHDIGLGPAPVTSTGVLETDAPNALGKSGLTTLIATSTSGGSSTSGGPPGSGSPEELAKARRLFAKSIGKEDVLNELNLDAVIEMHNAAVAPPVVPAPALDRDALDAFHPSRMPEGQIPLLHNWEKTTRVNYAGIVKYPRSAELTAVDQAVARYNQSRTEENFRSLQNSIVAWKNSKKGPDDASNWENSIRAAQMKELDAFVQSIEIRSQIDDALAQYKATRSKSDLRDLANAIKRLRDDKSLGSAVHKIHASYIDDLVKFAYNEHLLRVRHKLQNDPMKFLGKSVITVQGTPNDTKNFMLDFFDDNLAFASRATPYKLSIYNHGPALQMASVAMHSSVKSTTTREELEKTFYAIPPDADLLTTGQITGCLFITRTNPTTGQLECTHIQPKGWRDGDELETYIKSLGISGTNVTYWGRHEYGNVAAVTIVGKRNSDDGTWNVYGQQLKSVNNNFQIVNTKQFVTHNQNSAMPT